MLLFSLQNRKYETFVVRILTGFVLDQATGGGGSSIVKVPGDVPPARVYFFGLLV